MSETLALAKLLISKSSVTPDDKGCQALMIDRLNKIGFTVKVLKFGEVDNFWAVRGDSGPVFAFAGHTDVVPAGDESLWRTDPFTPTIKDGMLYGRGAADMKGSLASMVIATEKFIEKNPNHNGMIGFLITSDEEGLAVNGTIKVMEYLKENNHYHYPRTHRIIDLKLVLQDVLGYLLIEDMQYVLAFLLFLSKHLKNPFCHSL